MKRWGTRLAGALAALLLLLLVLVLETAPTLPAAPPPGGAEVQLARSAFRDLRTAVTEGDGQHLLPLSQDDLHGIAQLAGRGLGIQRTDAGVGPAGVWGKASIDLPLGLWLNLAAEAGPTTQGFPPLRLTAGDLSLSGAPARWVADLGRLLLVWRGARLQPLDALVTMLAVNQDGAIVQLGPGLGRTGLVNDALAQLGGTPLDQARVAALYCRLADQQRTAPSTDVAVQLQRMLAATRADDAATAVAEHRAGLVAMALVVAGQRALRLVKDDALPLDRCPFPAVEPVLAGRPDLAKHWAISAALVGIGGRRTSQLMGEWKELADSMAGGSGFSFTDLAADRAGIRLGVAATDPARALALRADLAGRSNASLLPPAVLGLAEGLRDDQFRADYKDTDSARFAAAVRQVDAILARGKVPG